MAAAFDRGATGRDIDREDLGHLGLAAAEAVLEDHVRTGALQNDTQQGSVSGRERLRRAHRFVLL